MDKLLDEHLKSKIIPFWDKQVDIDFGGYFGYVGLDLSVDKQADKGAVKITRLLWAYAALYNQYHESAHLEHARIAYQYLMNFLYDRIDKGVFWKSSFQGRILNDTKHLYAQCFAIYGLSEFFKSTGDLQVLASAMEIFRVVEAKAYHPQTNSYTEQFDRGWTPMDNTLLAANDILPIYTTNSILHLIEAYTVLYEISGDESVQKCLSRLLLLFYDRIYNQKTQTCSVFFDKNWNSMSDAISVGHDLEASWLIDRAIKIVGIDQPNLSVMTEHLCTHAFLNYYENGMVISEINHGIVNDSLTWWVQAEAIIGFYNYYQKSLDERYFTATWDTISVTMSKIVDVRFGSEWFWAVDRTGTPLRDHGISENWKANYHNVRMCLEIMKRRN